MTSTQNLRFWESNFSSKRMLVVYWCRYKERKGRLKSGLLFFGFPRIPFFTVSRIRKPQYIFLNIPVFQIKLHIITSKLISWAWEFRHTGKHIWEIRQVFLSSFGCYGKYFYLLLVAMASISIFFWLLYYFRSQAFLNNSEVRLKELGAIMISREIRRRSLIFLILIGRS